MTLTTSGLPWVNQKIILKYLKEGDGVANQELRRQALSELQQENPHLHAIMLSAGAFRFDTRPDFDLYTLLVSAAKSSNYILAGCLPYSCLPEVTTQHVDRLVLQAKQPEGSFRYASQGLELLANENAEAVAAALTVNDTSLLDMDALFKCGTMYNALVLAAASLPKTYIKPEKLVNS